MSDQRAGWAAGRKGSVVVESAGPGRWCNAHGGKHGDRVRGREQEVEAQSVVEISEVARRLLRVVVVRRLAIMIIIIVVMVVHDNFNVFAEVLDESSLALLAVHDMHEATFRGSDGLPRK